MRTFLPSEIQALSMIWNLIPSAVLRVGHKIITMASDSRTRPWRPALRYNFVLFIVWYSYTYVCLSEGGGAERARIPEANSKTKKNHHRAYSALRQANVKHICGWPPLRQKKKKNYVKKKLDKKKKKNYYKPTKHREQTQSTCTAVAIK